MKILIGILVILTVLAQASMWEWTHWKVVEKRTFVLDIAAPISGIDHVHYKFHFPATLEKDICTQANQWEIDIFSFGGEYKLDMVDKCP